MLVEYENKYREEALFDCHFDLHVCTELLGHEQSLLIFAIRLQLVSY